MSNVTTDFIRATNKIYGKVAAILTHLQVIEGHVKLISENPVHDAHTPKAESNGSNSCTNPDIPASTVGRHIKTGESKGNEHTRKGEEKDQTKTLKQRWRKSIKKPVVQLEIAALIGLALYTCETRRTNTLTEKSMNFQFSLARSQERSYLQVDLTPLAQVKLEEIQRLGIELGLKNLGKSTASKISGKALYEILLSTQEPSLKYEGTIVAGFTAPLVPGGIGRIPAAIIDQERSGPQAMPEAIRDDLKSGRKYIIVFGHVEYEDAYGYWWQDFCGWRSFKQEFGSFNAGSCVSYNAEGGTPKKPSTN